ncbi:hemerythrin domain-containing protein [Paracoccus benzoatiresistens]|uniref:Hemerythrin domain-containing protein n=1 Tax=Paracoccus benzoatiresistens TaxID=2997341 RepID=A0ABT4J919_9RHOB|nr:hemerythrin domain-containing protein [Paracoccus sp. EF6]MCZ0963587.1 hemerythrin domain-containing protein [Paracoccus sp. EF6]
MSFAIPKPLKTEHDHLHDDLRAALAKGGRTEQAARVVAERLHPHFLAEEEFAMPPLGLLSTLAEPQGGTVSSEDARTAVAMADRLAAEMPRMLAEHREIVAALRSLIASAQEEGHGDVVMFAEALMLHARTEEEVLYPAAILVGRYLKLTAQAGSGRVSGLSG